MGTGKTLVALEKIRILYNQNIIKNILIICPLSVLETWATEIVKHTTFNYTKLIGPLETKVKLLANGAPIFLISYDSIPGRKKTLGILFHLLLNKHFDMIILDEITHIKNFNATRTKTVTLLCNKINRVLALSGTPITNSPESVITIYNCVDGGETFGRNYFAARNHFFVNHGYGFPDWRLRKDTEEEFKKRLYFNATRQTKEECLDLPPKIFTERYTELIGIQRDIYRKIAQELLKELILPEGRVKIQNSLVKLAKLSQLTGGFLYTDKKAQIFDENPKLELLKEVIEEIPQTDKIIIFAKWTQDIKTIAKQLDILRINHVILSGQTKDRGKLINNFINIANIKILLSQITTGAYGLNLTCSSVVIYYSLGFSSVEFWQSQDRIHRIGQDKSCVYISLLAENTIDTYIHDCLKKHTAISKSLLNDNYRLRLKENLSCL